MRRRQRLAWKLSVSILVIVSAAIFGTGYLGSQLSRRYTMVAAREIMQFNSEMITSFLGKVMMSGDSSEVRDVIGDMTRRSGTYEDMTLVLHPSGVVSVSRLLETGARLEIHDDICGSCHTGADEPRVVPDAKDEVVVKPDGSRVLRVSTPVINKLNCRIAACHAHTESGNILGILKTDYSLAIYDNFMTGLNVLLALAAILGILLTISALLTTFRWVLAKPLRRLVTGIGAFADDDLAFRFPARSDDEFGLVEDSFNNMASRIQAHQKETRNTLEHLQGIVENTADLVISVNRSDLIETFNRGAELALGYARKEVLGKRIETLLADAHEREIAIARLRGKDNVTNWETQFKTKDGKIRNVLLTLSRLRDHRGFLVGTISIGKDITVEKELQRKLIRSEQEAAIGRAVTGIQHAIKNMLNTLKGGVYIARVGQKKNRPEQIHEGCDMVDEGLKQIADLSTNMLRYAREWKIDPEPVDLPHMIDRITTAVRQTAIDRGVALGTEVIDSLTEVPCDPRLIHMCLMDIVSNALDACWSKDYNNSEEAAIHIRLYRSPDGGNAVFEISDNGIGMTREIVENVFTPFFSTKKKWGTGLGLALTSRIIDLHNGEITVESEPDKGSLFRIALPLQGARKRTGEPS